jgi:hypothetical protein
VAAWPENLIVAVDWAILSNQNCLSTLNERSDQPNTIRAPLAESTKTSSLATMTGRNIGGNPHEKPDPEPVRFYCRTELCCVWQSDGRRHPAAYLLPRTNESRSIGQVLQQTNGSRIWRRLHYILAAFTETGGAPAQSQPGAADAGGLYDRLSWRQSVQAYDQNAKFIGWKPGIGSLTAGPYSNELPSRCQRPQVGVVFQNDRGEGRGRRVDQYSDLAVIKIETPMVSSQRRANRAGEVGEWVIAIANPAGRGPVYHRHHRRSMARLFLRKPLSPYPLPSR